tara:strand:+ start:921 stop:1175 length:255 start_codon:yes stop_codon:yes gene_type:complete
MPTIAALPCSNQWLYTVLGTNAMARRASFAFSHVAPLHSPECGSRRRARRIWSYSERSSSHESLSHSRISAAIVAMIVLPPPVQ